MDAKNIYLPDIVGGGYDEFWKCKKRYRVVKGSRASKKSKTAALWFIWAIMKYRDANLLVVRRTYRTLERSCFAELKWAITRLSVTEFFEFRLSPLEIIYTPTGQRIFFAGLDDPLKLTSITVSSGSLCWMWIEEAYEIPDEASFNTLDESIRGEVCGGLFKQITLTFNPWSENHWLKKRFFDTPQNDILALSVNYKCNEWLDKSDLAMFEEMKLRDPERYRVAGLGEWGVTGGIFFPEFMRERHVVEPFELPRGCIVYRAVDYGLDALACLWIAVDTLGFAYVLRELYATDLIVSEAAELIRLHSPEEVRRTYAPPDLASRQKDTGKTIAELFHAGGILLDETDNNRVCGWLNVKEWLKCVRAPDGGECSRLKIFSSCTNLIRCLQSLKADKIKIGDCAHTPHELTHLPDALRYFCVMRTQSGKPPDDERRAALAKTFLQNQNSRRGRFN